MLQPCLRLLVLMAIALSLFTFNGNPLFCYFLVVPIVIGFATAYPTMHSLFSLSAGADEQGWAMGIMSALFTLGSGIISLAGGAMMTIDVRRPFVAGVAHVDQYTDALYRLSGPTSSDIIEVQTGLR